VTAVLLHVLGSVTRQDRTENRLAKRPTNRENQLQDDPLDFVAGAVVEFRGSRAGMPAIFWAVTSAPPAAM
jgi:hypothetical protein